MNQSFSIFPLILIVGCAILLTACGKSAADLCVEKNSHLWDAKTHDKNANKAYWVAVAKCREKQ